MHWLGFTRILNLELYSNGVVLPVIHRKETR